MWGTRHRVPADTHPSRAVSVAPALRGDPGATPYKARGNESVDTDLDHTTDLDALDPEPRPDGLVDIKIPDGMELPDPESDAVPPTVDATTTETPVTTEAKPDKGDLRGALHEARNKTRFYRELWQKTKQESEKVRGSDTLSAVSRLEPPTSDRVGTKKASEEVTTMPEHTDVVLGEVDRLFKAHTDRIETHLWQRRIADQENDMRDLHGNFDAVLEKSGIRDRLSLLPTGQLKDPIIAKAVYGDRNPARAAYFLGLQELEAAGRLAEVQGAEDEAERVEPEKPEKPVAPAKVEAKPAPRTVAEAERAGERRVIEAVSTNASRPRGIQRIVDSGEPGHARVTVSYLDNLLYTNPDAWKRIIEQNPHLERLQLGGF